jgi:hypothetical protein
MRLGHVDEEPEQIEGAESGAYCAFSGDVYSIQLARSSKTTEPCRRN